MATLQLEQNTMKNSTEYLPILRSVLKSQIQFLVEQLSDAGEETFILSANVKDGAVEQLGSESGKLFANVYDDFKSEFLGFCQRRQGKRKLESPQKTPVDAKRGKAAPAVMAVKSPQNVPKVSSARVIMSHKQASSATSTAGNQGIQPSDQPGIVELGESGEDYSEVEDTGLGYEELQDVQTWEGEEQSQDTSTISQVAPSGSKGTSTSVQKKIVTTIQRRRQGPEFICEHCEAIYMTEESLNQHIQIKHEHAKPNFECKICNKGFHSSRTLRAHTLRHGDKNFQCSTCAKCYYTITELKQHERKSHVKGKANEEGQKKAVNIEVMFKKALSCSECGKLFLRPDALETHMLVHTKENPFTCHICGLGYRNKSSYDKHVAKKHFKRVLDEDSDD